MAHIGFIRTRKDESPDRELVRRLQQTGIPLRNIFTDQEFRLNAEWLRNGNHLTVCSLAVLNDHADSLLHILSTCITRKIHLHSLAEPWYDTDTETVRQHICGLAELSGLTVGCEKYLPPKQKKFRGRPRGLTPESLAKCKACEKLLLTIRQPLLAVLKSQHLCYTTWRRYVQDYKSRKERETTLTN